MLGDKKLPKVVQDALDGMSHTNSRPLHTGWCAGDSKACDCYDYLVGSEVGGKKVGKDKKRWPEFYTPELAQMVLEMYDKDFEMFGYSKVLPAVPPPKPDKADAAEKGNAEPLLSKEKAAPTEGTPLIRP